jgi:hypothetical protein
VGGEPDESSARQTLIEMQLRIATGPHVALGLTEASSSSEQVRGAFLQLTKRFHPARFGRMSQDVQRLSNEVFLGIKSAHDQLMRVASNTRGSAPMPIVAESSQAYDRRIAPGQPLVTPRTLTPRALTPVRGVPVMQPPTQPPTVSRTPTPPLTPPRGTPAQRSPSPPLGSRALIDPPSQRSAPRLAPAFDERAQLQHALDLMKAGDYRAAREALHSLAARVPQSRQYRGLLCFARGREAHVASRFDDAALEYQRALQLDPDLVQAKQALVDAQRRR